MKVKDGFLLYEIMNEWVLVPGNEDVVRFDAIITLSESAALLWNKLQTQATEEELYEELLATYDIDCETAIADVRDFIESLKKEDLLECG